VWDNTGPPRQVANGVDGSVETLERHGDLLVVGGSFTSALPSGGRPVPTGGLAYFDPGTELWGVVGKMPLVGAVRALLSRGDKLYVGGLIASHGGKAAGHVLVHSGPLNENGGWLSIGGVQGEGAYVSVLEALGEEVLVGGQFVSAGGSVLANNLARYDGREWHRLADADCQKRCRYVGEQRSCAEEVCDLNGPVTAIAVSGPTIFAAGGFVHAGGNVVNGLARYSNGRWFAVGRGVVGTVNVLSFMRLSVPNKQFVKGVVDGACLYVGGRFQAVGQDAKNLAQYCVEKSEDQGVEVLDGAMEAVPSIGSSIGVVHALLQGFEYFGHGD